MCALSGMAGLDRPVDGFLVTFIGSDRAQGNLSFMFCISCVSFMKIPKVKLPEAVPEDAVSNVCY